MTTARVVSFLGKTVGAAAVTSLAFYGGAETLINIAAATGEAVSNDPRIRLANNLVCIGVPFILSLGAYGALFWPGSRSSAEQQPLANVAAPRYGATRATA